MRYLTAVVTTMLFLSAAGIAAASTPGVIQIRNSAQEKAASLRLQLSEVETKQSELQTRLQQLDENLKQENIENSLAGIGSTHPEDLREQRRRQLEIERNGVRAQLDLLTTSHTRLETAIAQADGDAYRQSALSVSPSTPTAATPTRARRVRRRRRVRR